MSQAEEMLNALSGGPVEEEPIIIGYDRKITVPDSLKRIAVQNDHNIESVTFKCPSTWDGNDLSGMQFYINYVLPNGTLGCYAVDHVEGSGSDYLYFVWTITKNVTKFKGNLIFNVCAKAVDAEGNEEFHWNSELNKEMVVSEGLECGEHVVEEHPDVITYMLNQLNNAVTNGHQINPITENLTTTKAVWEFVDGVSTEIKSEIPEEITIDSELSTESTNPVQNKVITEKTKVLDTKLDALHSMVGSALTTLTGSEDGVVYRADLGKTFDTIINNDGEDAEYPEIESIKNAWTKYIYNGEDVGYIPTELKLKDSKAREMIGDIETALDNIIAMQGNLIGGDVE